MMRKYAGNKKSIEARSHVGRRSPLASVAGHKQRNIRHSFSQSTQFFGPRGSHNGPDAAVKCIRPVGSVQSLQDVGHGFKKRCVAVGVVLENAGTWIAGSDKHVDSGVSFQSGVDEWLQRVFAQVGINGQSICGKWCGGRIFSCHPRRGVGFGRGTNISTFGVGDYDQARVSSVLNHVLRGQHSGGSQLFEERDLRLHGRDQRRNDVDNFTTKCVVTSRALFFDGSAFRCGSRLDFVGQQIPPRIEANQSRCA